MSSIYDWSLVAAENARADEIINWAEGQPPSSVNDSARAMMQRVKEYLS
ncbi:MAG: phage tail protein, partial [Bartonella sp.]|nr:phage tail protein [Bartonella sp.]